jgi:hypothetical protein
MYAIVWCLLAGYPSISSHPLPILPKPEQLFLNNFLWKLWMLHCLPTLSLCEYRDVLWGHNWVTWEMHLEAIMKGVWRCTWRPWLVEIAEVLWDSRFGGGWLGGKCNRSWEFIDWLTCNCGNVESWVQWDPLRDYRLLGSARELILGWCSIWRKVNSVYAVLGVCYTLCLLMIMAWKNRERWFDFMFSGNGRVENKKERDKRRWEIIMRNWDLREYGVWVNLPFPIWQVWLPIWHVMTLIQGLLNPI